MNSLAKVNPGSWRLLIRIHSTNTGQISEPAVWGRAPHCSQGEVKFRTEAGRSDSQKGSDLGDELVGLQR